MEEITQQLLEEFNFKVRSIRKSKYMYICRNERQARIIKLSSQSCEQILFIEEIKKRLLENGFKNIDKYYFSSQQTPFFSCENGVYVMSDYIDYPEADFENPKQMKEIVKAVAKIHKLGSGYEMKNPEPYQASAIDKFEKGIKKLKSIKKIVCSQKKYSDFDISFIKHYESYLSDALEAQEILNNSKIIALNEEGIKRRLFCHNALKEENILFSSKGIFITGFDNATPQHYVLDLYQLIERYMRKHGAEYLTLEELLDIYFRYNEKDERLYPILFAFLKFPFRFIKICESFYNKKRNWVPNSTKEQLKELLELKEINEKYIAEVFKS